jgi:hypothetical protein
MILTTKHPANERVDLVYATERIRGSRRSCGTSSSSTTRSSRSAFPARMVSTRARSSSVH